MAFTGVRDRLALYTYPGEGSNIRPLCKHLRMAATGSLATQADNDLDAIDIEIVVWMALLGPKTVGLGESDLAIIHQEIRALLTFSEFGLTFDQQLNLVPDFVTAYGVGWRCLYSGPGPWFQPWEPAFATIVKRIEFWVRKTIKWFSATLVLDLQDPLQLMPDAGDYSILAHALVTASGACCRGSNVAEQPLTCLSQHTLDAWSPGVWRDGRVVVVSLNAFIAQAVKGPSVRGSARFQAGAIAQGLLYQTKRQEWPLIFGPVLMWRCNEKHEGNSRASSSRESEMQYCVVCRDQGRSVLFSDDTHAHVAKQRFIVPEDRRGHHAIELWKKCQFKACDNYCRASQCPLCPAHRVSKRFTQLWVRKPYLRIETANESVNSNQSAILNELQLGLSGDDLIWFTKTRFGWDELAIARYMNCTVGHVQEIRTQLMREFRKVARESR